MSVLINGMEMPKDGTYNIVHIYSDGYVSMPFWGKGMQIVQGVNAVPVPPHGRLIDGNILEVVVEKHYKHHKISRYDRDLLLHYLDIEMAPTIIPASEEGE